MSRHPDWTRRWRVWKDRGDWIVSSPEHDTRGFPTWAEALAYADRMARTREIELPRFAENNAIVPGALGLSLEPGRTWNGARNAWVKDGAGMVYVASYDLRPLALALLALAEREEVGE